MSTSSTSRRCEHRNLVGKCLECVADGIADAPFDMEHIIQILDTAEVEPITHARADVTFLVRGRERTYEYDGSRGVDAWASSDALKLRALAHLRDALEDGTWRGLNGVISRDKRRRK